MSNLDGPSSRLEDIRRARQLAEKPPVVPAPTTAVVSSARFQWLVHHGIINADGSLTELGRSAIGTAFKKCEVF